MTCKTCELVARRNAGLAPPWDSIYRTSCWDVAHCFDTYLPGWLVLVLRRHLASLAELTEVEAVELGQLIRHTSIALKQVTGCVKTYAIQLAESPDHLHVHFHIIPRLVDPPPERAGVKIFSCIGVPEAERVSEEEMNAIADRIRGLLLTTRFEIAV